MDDSEASSVAQPPRVHGYGRAAFVGAVSAVVAAFPHAALIALTYRFPVPFVGIVSGPSAVPGALFATFFFGVLLGGFIPVALLGALGGALIRYGLPAQSPVLKLAALWGVLVSAAGVLLLAVLDKFIGPW